MYVKRHRTFLAYVFRRFLSFILVHVDVSACKFRVARTARRGACKWIDRPRASGIVTEAAYEMYGICQVNERGVRGGRWLCAALFTGVHEASVCVSRCIALCTLLAHAFAIIRNPWHFDYAITSFADDTLVILARGERVAIIVGKLRGKSNMSSEKKKRGNSSPSNVDNALAARRGS